MDFPASGVQCAAWLPSAAAFVVAFVTAPAGISGAFLLLPFQMSVLGFVSPGVTPTNLIYNIVATPGGVYRYVRDRRMDWKLAGAVLAGSIPGMFAGVFLRVRYLPDPKYIRIFAGLVLLYLGIRLLTDIVHAPAGDIDRLAGSPRLLALAAFPVGIIGGIYGVGGGAIIAPFAVSVAHLPAKRVAGAALFGTLITSIAGIVSFEFLQQWGGVAVRPDWALGLMFGVGGLFGSYAGARMQSYLPERYIRLLLGLFALQIALSYCAQLIGVIGTHRP